MATNLVELRVPVPDRPGVLAEVTTLAGRLGVNVDDVEIAHSLEGGGGVIVLVVAAADADALRERAAAISATSRVADGPRSEPVPDGARRSAGVRALRGRLRVPGRQVDLAPGAAVRGAGRRRSAITQPRDRRRRARDARGARAARGGDPHRRATRVVRARRRASTAWSEPDDVLDCENSGTTMRVLAGVLAGRPFLSVLTGDASLRQRPMARVVEPLRAMGAHVDGRDDGDAAPLVIRGGALHGVRHELPVASAQVKSALVLAGLQADGATEIVSPGRSRDHTERMLGALGAPGRGRRLHRCASGGRAGAVRARRPGRSVVGGVLRRGAPPITGDLAVTGQTIAAIGPLPDAHRRVELDAQGIAVAPGFINMLSWANRALIEDGRSQSDIRQGVTLEIMGEGTSMGPLTETMKRQINDQQGDIKYDVNWTTLGQYQHLVQRGVSCNVASFVGATTARIHEIGYADRPPTPEELHRMKQLVRQAMAEGALGIASALIYAPACYAKTEELIATRR